MHMVSYVWYDTISYDTLPGLVDVVVYPPAQVSMV